jgi:hypothetical protein
MFKTGDNMNSKNKVKRAFTIEEKVEDCLTRLSRDGVSRSFFANQAIKDRLKKLGFW